MCGLVSILFLVGVPAGTCDWIGGKNTSIHVQWLDPFRYVFRFSFFFCFLHSYLISFFSSVVTEAYDAWTAADYIIESMKILVNSKIQMRIRPSKRFVERMNSSDHPDTCSNNDDRDNNGWTSFTSPTKYNMNLLNMQHEDEVKQDRKKKESLQRAGVLKQKAQRKTKSLEGNVGNTSTDLQDEIPEKNSSPGATASSSAPFCFFCLFECCPCQKKLQRSITV